jgi:hypothetical protein
MSPFFASQACSSQPLPDGNFSVKQTIDVASAVPP